MRSIQASSSMANLLKAASLRLARESLMSPVDSSSTSSSHALIAAVIVCVSPPPGHWRNNSKTSRSACVTCLAMSRPSSLAC